METLDIMEETALSIMESADCAIGYEAAHTVYKGLIGIVMIMWNILKMDVVHVHIVSRFRVYLCVRLM